LDARGSRERKKKGRKSDSKKEGKEKAMLRVPERGSGKRKKRGKERTRGPPTRRGRKEEMKRGKGEERGHLSLKG